MSRRIHKQQYAEKQTASEHNRLLSLSCTCVVVFLVSCCMLALEVALTRICCVILFYHMSFAIISCALLGMGLGGFAGYFLAGTNSTRIIVCAAVGVTAISPCILLATAILLLLSFEHVWVALIPLLMPVFCLAGIFQSLALRAFSERAGMLYAADLCGGALGALVSVVLLNALAGPINTVLGLSIVAAAAGAFFIVKSRSLLSQAAQRWLVPLALANVVLSMAVAALQYKTTFLDINYSHTPDKLIAKMLRPTPAGIPRLLRSQTRWDACSRVDVIEEPDLCRPETVQRTVFIDGEVPSAMVPISETWSPHYCKMSIRDTLPALPYRLFSPATVLCIGPGGGYDVVVAKLLGARKIDAVELNAGVLSVVADARDFTGDVYGQEGVHAIHGEGRQFVRSTGDATYDLLVMALAQSLVSNLAEYALSENYLYTSEAFCDYLRILRPTGVLAVLLNNQKLLLRLSATAQQSLDRLGYPGSECVIAFGSQSDAPYKFILIAKKGGYSASERTLFTQQAQQYDYRIIQGLDTTGYPSGLYEESSLHTIPATDDRPFFFHITRSPPPGLVMLLSVAMVMLFGALVMFTLLQPRDHAVLSSVAKYAGYFVCLGLAFIMVEVIVLQKTILILGFPTLNLAIVLAVFLFAAGLGSMASSTLMHTTVKRWLPVLVVLVGLSLTLIVPLLDLYRACADSLSVIVRSALIAVIIFPFAFFMGMPFPLAIRLLPKTQTALVSWFWGLNGMASILGSAVAVVLVLYMGFRVTSLLPTVLYCMAAALAFSFSRN